MKPKRVSLSLYLLLASGFASFGCGPSFQSLVNLGYHSSFRYLHDPSHVQSVETKILSGFADPDVVAMGNKFYLTGTGDNRSIEIFESSDFENFKPFTRVDPSNVDTNHVYCHIWAPSLVALSGNMLAVTFSSVRKAAGQPCGGFGTRELSIVTSYYFLIDQEGSPPQSIEEFYPGKRNHVRSYRDGICPAEGCQFKLAIDLDGFWDGDKLQLFYNFFDGGKQSNIASFDFANPTNFTVHSKPVSNRDSGISEAPDVFKRQGVYHLLFSTAATQTHQVIRHSFADNLESLGPLHSNEEQLSRVGYGRNGDIITNLGHTSTIELAGEHYVFFNRGRFENGKMVGRDIHRLKLHKKGEHQFHSLSSFRARINGWPSGRKVTLGLKTIDNESIPYCMEYDSSRGHEINFDGVCHQAEDRVIFKSHISEILICAEVACRVIDYDGYSDAFEVSFANFNRSVKGAFKVGERNIYFASGDSYCYIEDMEKFNRLTGSYDSHWLPQLDQHPEDLDFRDQCPYQIGAVNLEEAGIHYTQDGHSYCYIPTMEMFEELMGTSNVDHVPFFSKTTALPFVPDNTKNCDLNEIF